MSAYNFGGSKRNLTKPYQGTWLEAGVIKCILILQGVPLQNLEGQKCPKFGTISWNFTSASFRFYRAVDRIATASCRLSVRLSITLRYRDHIGYDRKEEINMD